MLTEIKTNALHYFVDENNLKQGEYKDYYNNGQLCEHSFYQYGNRHGEYKEYHANCRLNVHTSLQNGKLHGEYKQYSRNGQLFVHTFYQNGKKHGEYKEYHNNGELSYTTFFYQGGDLHVDPNSLTEKDKVYIMMSGRLPPRD
jgi:antitoxin component YwqK of YwqJK toxin-antitoxin module